MTGLANDKRDEAKAALEKLGGKEITFSPPKLSLEQLFLKTVEYERQGKKEDRPTNEANK